MKIEISANGKPVITEKNCENAESVLSYINVLCDLSRKLAPKDSCLNIIRVTESLRQKLGSDKYFVLANLANGRFINVITDDIALEGEGDLVRITAYIARTICADEASSFMLCTQKQFEFTKVKAQKLENVKSDKIVVPKGSIPDSFIKDFSLFEILNPLTNDSIFVQSKYIVTEKELLSGEVRINRKQRTMLSDNIPSRLSGRQHDELILNAQDKAAAQEILGSLYVPDGAAYVIRQNIDEISFDARNAIRSLINSQLGEKLIVRPVLESFRKPFKRGFIKRVCDFFVGKSTLSLNCRRPHECDENSDIVRMTEENMLFLGIEPMDKVVLRYKHNSVSCHVLPFDYDKFRITNVPCVEEFSIGIPAHIRNKLGIVDIQSAVKVDRDTGFIFRKSFNDQLIPVFLALMSLSFFENTKWYITLLFVIMLIPLVMYITLSSKRNMRGR